MLAPTAEELEKLYLKHDAFIEKGIAWDKEQLLVIAEWERKKQLMDKQFEHRDQITAPVEAWKPENELVALSEIDLLEKAYIEEYKLIAAKDVAEGKDFNGLAYEELKKSKYFFQYMRTNEKLY